MRPTPSATPVGRPPTPSAASLAGEPLQPLAAGVGPHAAVLLASDLAARGRYREALGYASSAARQAPDDFGAWYLTARCRDALGEPGEALAAYSTCIALRPASARAYLARGTLALAKMKDPALAKADFDQVLRLNPDSSEGLLNRALALRSLKRYPDALRDLDKLLDRPDAPARTWFVRAGVRDASGDKAGAAADRTVGLKTEPTDARSANARGIARLSTDPAAALADFRKAEELAPGSVEGLTNQAYVLGERLDKPAEVLEVLERALKLSPDDANLRGGRAVLLARLGRADEAKAEVKKGLEMRSRPDDLIRAASAYAVLGPKDPQAAPEAVRLLAQALLQGEGFGIVETDADLARVKDDAAFRRVAEAVRTLRAAADGKLR